MAAAGPRFYELLINNYLRSVKKKPTTVFLLVMPTTFSAMVDDFNEIGIHRYLNPPISNEKIVQTYSEWKTYPSLVVKSFQKGIKNLLFRPKASITTVADEVKDKGFYRSDEQTSGEKEKKEMVLYVDWKFQKFRESEFVYLQELATALKLKGITVAFFSLPGNKANSFFSSAYMSDYIQAEAKLKTAFKFFNISSLKMDSSLYRNIDHINTNGASVVSHRLISEILNDMELRSLFQPKNKGVGIP